MKIEQQDVIDFWDHMSEKYDFHVVDKKNASEMEAVGWALEQMGIQSKEDFLKRYTTTICLPGFRHVYVPFTIGSGSQGQRIHQIVTCAHECQHVIQADRDLLQPVKYLASDASRAHYEADAYRVSMEVHYFFTGNLYSPKKLANDLKGYDIGAADRRVVEKHLVIASKVVERGGVISGVSKESIKWWKKKNKKILFKKVIPIRFASRTALK